MSFEDDPKEDKEQFPCKCGGDIELHVYKDGTAYYECNSCDFKKKAGE